MVSLGGCHLLGDGLFVAVVSRSFDALAVERVEVDPVGLVGDEEAEQWERLYNMVATAVGYSGLHLTELNRYVDGWRRLDLPADLIPADPLEEESFSKQRFVDDLPLS